MALWRTVNAVAVGILLSCARAGECSLTLSLNGYDSIPIDGSGRILITDIGAANNEALICDSDQITSTGTSDWYINAASQSTASQDRILNEDARGWHRNRDTTNGIVRLLRNDNTMSRFEGVFTCQIEEDPASPISVGIYYAISSVDVRIDVISARDGTYTVSCTTTGGTVLSGSLTGPAGLNIPLQPVGTVNRRGQDSYSATTGTRTGGHNGDTYQCMATNGVSSPDATETLKVASAPVIQSVDQVLPGNKIRVTWSQALGGAPVISYRVYYSGGDDVGYVAREPSNTLVDIDGLNNDGRIYTISVEALSVHLSGESTAVDVVLVPLPRAPTGVIVNDVQPHSVQVSWIPQSNATRYIVDYEQVMGTDQQGLCSDVHSGSVTTADSTASVTVEGTDGSGDFRLQAFTTYSITVRAVRDGVGSSGPSEARIFTTAQTAADAPPAVGDVTAQSPTSILVQWDPIPHCQDINGNIIGYSVRYLELPDGPTEIELVPGTWNVSGQVTLSGLSPFTEYSIQMAAVNNRSDVGVYSDPVIRRTHEDTPGPVIISLSKSTFQITISWSPPEMPNGVIIAYEVSYLQTTNPENVTYVNTTEHTTSVLLCELQPETQYTFTVRAYTRAGAGEKSIAIYITSGRPDVFFQLHLNGLFNCQEWVDNRAEEKLTYVSSALRQVVQNSCQCRYGESEIDREVFHCFDGSQRSVTYRARLLATSDADIQSLTSYLEEWVAGGNNVVVEGVILSVDEDCSLEIADLLQQEEACREEATSSDITGVAVAIGVGGTILITSTIIVAGIIMIVFILRRRSNRVQQEVTKVPMSAHTDVQRERMYHNSAYGQMRIAEKEGSHKYVCSSRQQEPVYEVVYDN